MEKETTPPSTSDCQQQSTQILSGYIIPSIFYPIAAITASASSLAADPLQPPSSSSSSSKSSEKGDDSEFTDESTDESTGESTDESTDDEEEAAAAADSAAVVGGSSCFISNKDDLLENFVFKTKTLTLRQATFYIDIYDIGNTYEIEGSSSSSFRVYSGTQLFRHFKGLREWVMYVQFVSDGSKYIKDISSSFASSATVSSYDWKKISPKDTKKISKKLFKMVPTAKGVLDVENIQTSLITRKARGVSETEDDEEDISHNDVFEIEMRILLKPSNPKSLFFKKTAFLFQSHKTGEYTSDVRPVPHGDFLGSYDPITDFDEDRAILFTSWKILNDENLPLLGDSVSTNEEGTGEEGCMICIEGTRSHVAIPCGHFVLCATCSRRVGSENGMKCIVCRKKVDKFVKVHR